MNLSSMMPFIRRADSDRQKVSELRRQVGELEEKVAELEARRPLVEGPVKLYRSAATKQHMADYSVSLIKLVAEDAALDPLLLQAVAEKESDLNPFAVRVEPHLRNAQWYVKYMRQRGFDPEDLWNTASYGLMQILFVTALQYVSVESAFDLISQPVLALRAGAVHFKGLTKRYALADALSAYNAGTPTTKNWSNYVDVIIGRYSVLKRGGGEGWD